MTIITVGLAASIPATVKTNGQAVPVSVSVSASVVDMLGNPLLAPRAVASSASWADGVVVVPLTDAETATLPTGDAMLVLAGAFGVRRLKLTVEAAGQITRSALFIKDLAVERVREDRLVLAAAGAMPSVAISDDYIWDKLRAAESELAHELRVPLAPTAFFPETPTPDEITALNGMPWAIDAGYDYVPTDFGGDKWGFIKLRNKPVQSVSRVRFAYPGGPTAHYDLPLDWLRMDQRHGHVQFVPSSTAFIAPLNAFVMQALGNGRTIPLAMQVTYVAGLDNAARDFPELLDVIYKKASLKIIEDAYLPQSGSISADGLSQSMSNDMDKHHDTIDRIINGGKGSNGGLMAAIHGIRFGVM